MGNTLLTPHQLAVVEQAAREERLTGQYYFSGGTALTVCYLHHRKSEDLDFFTPGDINEDISDNFFAKNKKVFGYETLEKIHHYQMTFYLLKYPHNETLKVDFVKMPYPQIEKETHYDNTNLRVDSIMDIALNKFRAISDRTHARDYIDLYFILTTQDINLDQIIMRMYDKYAPFTYEDELQNVERLLHVVDMATDFPTMLIPFDKKTMRDFFLSEVKKRKKNIFR